MTIIRWLYALKDIHIFLFVLYKYYTNCIIQILHVEVLMHIFICIIQGGHWKTESSLIIFPNKIIKN